MMRPIPVGFTFHAEGVKLGIATDLGYLPASVCDHLRGCDVSGDGIQP